MHKTLIGALSALLLLTLTVSSPTASVKAAESLLLAQSTTPTPIAGVSGTLENPVIVGTILPDFDASQSASSTSAVLISNTCLMPVLCLGYPPAQVLGVTSESATFIHESYSVMTPPVDSSTALPKVDDGKEAVDALENSKKPMVTTDKPNPIANLDQSLANKAAAKQATKPVQPIKTEDPVNPVIVSIPEPSDKTPLYQQYGAVYGVDPVIMQKIASCESGERAEANNGPYGGMFQFATATWVSNRKAMGEDPNPVLRFNAEEAVKTAAFKMSRDGYGAWPACSRKVLASNN